MFRQKLGLLQPIFNKKCSTFSLIFPLYKNFLQTHASRMPSLTFSANMILLTKAKQVFKLIKDKNEIDVTLLAMISL